MGRRNRRYLTGPRIYGCVKCNSHLASFDAVISKQFTGQTGRAFLFQAVVNVEEGPQEDRHMTTGLHTVRDISCSRCKRTLGWKYDRAYEQTQQYKEGKYILEKAYLREIESIKDDMTTVEYDVDGMSPEVEQNGGPSEVATLSSPSVDDEMRSVSSASL